jgi:hypothetical protein
MQHSIEPAVFDLSGTTVKDKGEITNAFTKHLSKENIQSLKKKLLQELLALH